MSTVPSWLEQMRELDGVQFSPQRVGDRNVIHKWLDFIADQHEDMRRYCQAEKSQEYFAWCGLAVAYCMARTGQRPVFGSEEKHRFLWAAAWLDWGAEVPKSLHGTWAPAPGDVVVFDFGHGNQHVTLFSRDIGEGRWECWGGNQGHAVNASHFSSRQAIGVRRPSAGAQSGPRETSPQFEDDRPHHHAWSPYDQSDIGNTGGHSMAGLTSDVIAAAQKSQARWGVPASITLAQFILESSAGKNMPPGSNNPFGIKAAGSQPSVMAWTSEEKNGQRFRIRAPFRKFASFDEAFDQHGQLLAHHYRDAMAHADDPDAFADKLTGHYATASNYGRRLKEVMSQFNLRRYDTSRPMETNLHSGWNPWTEFVQEGDQTMVLTLGSTGAQVKALQDALTELGYWLGDVDEEFGPLTQQALMAFQKDNNVASDGVAGQDTWIALRSARPRSLPKDRTGADASDLRNGGSRILTQSNRTSWAGLISIILGVLGMGNSIAVNANPGTGAGKIPASFDALTKNIGIVKDLIDNLPKGGKPLAANDLAALTGNIEPALKKLIENFDPAIKQMQDFNPTPQVHSVLDFLTGSLSSPTGVNMLSTISSTIGSIIPGFGGSLLALGLGFASRYFASQISQARVEDHRMGKHIGKLPNSDNRK